MITAKGVRTLTEKHHGHSYSTTRSCGSSPIAFPLVAAFAVLVPRCRTAGGERSHRGPPCRHWCLPCRRKRRGRSMFPGFCSAADSDWMTLARVFLFFTAVLWLASGLFALGYLAKDSRRHLFFVFLPARDEREFRLDPCSRYGVVLRVFRVDEFRILRTGRVQRRRRSSSVQAACISRWSSSASCFCSRDWSWPPRRPGRCAGVVSAIGWRKRRLAASRCSSCSLGWP